MPLKLKITKLLTIHYVIMFKIRKWVQIEKEAIDPKLFTLFCCRLCYHSNVVKCPFCQSSWRDAWPRFPLPVIAKKAFKTWEIRLIINGECYEKWKFSKNVKIINFCRLSWWSIKKSWLFFKKNPTYQKLLFLVTLSMQNITIQKISKINKLYNLLCIILSVPFP